MAGILDSIFNSLSLAEFQNLLIFLYFLTILSVLFFIMITSIYTSSRKIEYI